MDDHELASKHAGRAAYLVCAVTTPVAMIFPLTFPFVVVAVIGAIGLAIRGSDWRPSIGALLWAIALGFFEWQYVETATIGFG